jgi:hypothetical protein
MKQTLIYKAALKLALISSVGLLVACGSGSGVNSDVSTTTISGSIVAAPVNGAQVSVVDANGNVVAGPVTTNNAGQYSLSIPNSSLDQDLIVKSTGGAFTDEATGNSGTAGEMFTYALANSLSNGGSVSVTPGSSIIAHLVMDHSRTMTQAQNAFALAFGYTPDMSVVPADATTAPAVDAVAASTLAGFRAAAFSQLAMDLGLSQDDQFEMFAALAQDLSDDVLDGVAGSSGAVAIGATGSSLAANIQSRFAAALVNFSNNTGRNQTLLNNAQIGNLPFGKVAFTVDDPLSSNPTSTYQIEYKQIGMMAAMEGKSTFQIHITNRETGADVTGLTPMLMPMMHMSTMTHSSPMPTTTVSEDGNGLYTVTLYYLMASQMMDGTSMGYWDLKFTVNGEEAHFYPAVMMAMGDTAKVRLKGQADVIKDMMGMDASRDYFIFKDSLTGMGPYTFTMFIAAKATMMSFPAVLVPGTLQSDMMGMAPALTVATVLVEVSDDDGVSWTTATTAGTDGIWTATGLSLTSGEQNQVRVRLTVNGEVKTTDGTAPDADTFDYNTFTLTPGGM